MEDKIKVIDEIVTHHPWCGVDKGWSTYTGGMTDSGHWFYQKMVGVPIQELSEFLNNLNNPTEKQLKTTTFNEDLEWLNNEITKDISKAIEYFEKTGELPIIEIQPSQNEHDSGQCNSLNVRN